MRKTILVLAVVLLATVNIDAQNRRKPHRGRQINRTERLDMRAERLTDVMSSTYKLDETQQKSLLELNKKWLNKNTNRPEVKRGDKTSRTEMRDRRNQLDSLYMANPTLHREVRIRELTADVDQYKSELKKIMTSSQFKAYQKRLSDGVAQLSK